MHNIMKKLLTLPLVALFVNAVAYQYPVQGFNNKPMPSFKLVDTTGKTMTNSSLKGKVYLVDFWATWCGPCKAAMPTMQKLHNKYKAKGFMVIGANILERGSGSAKADIAAKFKKDAKLSYVFTKNTPEAEKFADTLKIQGIPTFLLVDKKGIVRHVEVGFSAAHEADLARRIESLLK